MDWDAAHKRRWRRSGELRSACASMWVRGTSFSTCYPSHRRGSSAEADVETGGTKLVARPSFDHQPTKGKTLSPPAEDDQLTICKVRDRSLLHRPPPLLYFSCSIASLSSLSAFFFTVIRAALLLVRSSSVFTSAMLLRCSLCRSASTFPHCIPLLLTIFPLELVFFTFFSFCCLFSHHLFFVLRLPLC